MLYRPISYRSWCAAVGLSLSTASLLLLTGCVSAPKEAPPAQVACPEGVPAGTQCWRGQDSAGSHYLLAKPAQWSGVLVVHAHGGPALGEPKATRADEDIKRWAITLTEGHAWAGSVFRQGGFAVTTAAEDTERVRRIFADHVAKPQRTLLHGQSWGAMVATRAAEMYPQSWEGMLLTSGVVAGPTTYDFRLDLRAIYQHLCQNHPRPDEPQYPLSLGLPADNPMTAAELNTRVNDCLGVRKPAAQRSPEQIQKIKTIVDVLKIPENAIAGHLNWGTFTLRDVVTKSGGASPFGNDMVKYRGSANDAALNVAVLRFKADPQASARFDADVNHRGRFKVPVLAAHGIRDSTVFVEGSDTLRLRMEAAGNSARLVQTYVDSAEHSYWGDAMYPPLFEALLAWVNQGTKPTPVGIAARCAPLRPAQASECRHQAAYTPQPLATRIAPR
jgi:pimeloyl-ACP methyl ester carboxylesterase